RLLRLLSSILAITLLTVLPSYVCSANFVQGVTKLNSHLSDGTPVKVEVQTKNVSSQYPYKNAFMWGGDMQGEGKVLMPKTVITTINVQIGKQKNFVPLSAYCDLGDPHQATLEKAEHGFKLIIIGGETASLYKAELVFNNEYIQRRKVTNSEFPDEVWEETIYSFINKDDKR